MTNSLTDRLGFSNSFYRIAVCIGLVALTVASQAAMGDGGENQVTAVRVETLADNIEGGSGGVAIDAQGNVYTADFGSRLGRGGEGGHRVYKITPDGIVKLFAQGFRGASGNCFDTDGNLYQSSVGGNFISKVTPNGNVAKFSTGGYSNPVGLVMDRQANLFVCNCGSGSIRKTTKDGKSTLFVKSPLLKCPNGITIDDDGNLYVANFYNGDVIKITPDAKATKLATLPGNNNGHLTFFKGSLFVIARSAHQIYQVSLDGDVSLFAGSGKRGKDDGDPLKATFSLPNDIGVSPDGKFMYVNEVAPISGSSQVLAPTRVRRIVLGGAPTEAPASKKIDSQAMLKKGAAVYKKGMCFKCHGEEGAGAKFGPDISNSKWEHCDGSVDGILQVLTQGISKKDIKDKSHPYAMNPATNMIKNQHDQEPTGLENSRGVRQVAQ